MNLEDFPEDLKKDIEDQSLAILKIIKDDIIVIIAEDNFNNIKEKLISADLKLRDSELKGRIKDPGRLENMLLINTGINIRDYLKFNMCFIFDFMEINFASMLTS